MYSDCLLENKTKRGKLLLKYLKDGTWGFQVMYNNSCTTIIFDPWNGKLIEESFEYFKDYYIDNALQQLKRRGKYIDMSEMDFNYKQNDAKKKIGKEWFFAEVEEDRKLHINGRYCAALESLTRFGQRCDTSLIEIPNIRVVAVLSKPEHGGWSDQELELFGKRNGYQGIEEYEFRGWTPIDYCPFCGEKLPERLDKKIIEVLKNEYDLESWEDYKKAPAEFHSDEWWRKRGL